MSVAKAKKGRTRAPHLGPDRRRPAVLDAAAAMALQGGLRGVSMEGVARRLGVTKPVIYSCFASREELLAALLDREQEKLFRDVVSHLPQQPDFSDPEALLVQGFQSFLRAVADNAATWKLVFGSEPDPVIADRYAQGRRWVADRLAMLMRPGLVHWQVTDVERKLPVLVEMIISAGDGAVRALLESGDWTPEEMGELVGRMFLGALRRA